MSVPSRLVRFSILSSRRIRICVRLLVPARFSEVLVADQLTGDLFRLTDELLEQALTGDLRLFWHLNVRPFRVSRTCSLTSGLQRDEGSGPSADGELKHDAGPSFSAGSPAAVLIYSMSVSVDGFIADRRGEFGWTAPDDELFGFHLARVRELGCCMCGRRLYETMLPWETDVSLRDTELHAAFADVWSALPKVVFSRTRKSVQGNARLATATVAEEVAALLASTDQDVEIGGANLAGTALDLGLIDELRMFRHPIVVGAGRRFLPPVAEEVSLQLLETRTFGARVIYERYRLVR